MKILVLIALFSLLPLNAGAEPSDSGFEIMNAIDSVLREASLDGSGYAIIVEIDGNVIMSKGYGYADRENDIPFKLTTVAQIGSLAAGIRDELTMPHSPWVDGIAEGYGWYFRSDDSGRVRQMSHSGSDGVFFSYYWHRLDEHAFMYFVGNSGEEPTKNSLRRILGLLTSLLQDLGSE